MIRRRAKIWWVHARPRWRINLHSTTVWYEKRSMWTPMFDFVAFGATVNWLCFEIDGTRLLLFCCVLVIETMISFQSLRNLSFHAIFFEHCRNGGAKNIRRLFVLNVFVILLRAFCDSVLMPCSIPSVSKTCRSKYSLSTFSSSDVNYELLSRDKLCINSVDRSGGGLFVEFLWKNEKAA